MIFLITPGISPPQLLHVLLVDDDHDIHLVLGDIIVEGAVPCRIEHAYTGDEALSKMRADPPDLLILDVRMPIMDGLALRAAMLQEDNLLGVQVAVFTGHRMSATELQVLMADYYLPKPVSIQDLMTVIAKAQAGVEVGEERARNRREAALRRINTLLGDIEHLRDRLARDLKKDEKK